MNEAEKNKKKPQLLLDEIQNLYVVGSKGPQGYKRGDIIADFASCNRSAGESPIRR
jgi:hypothetical protein